MEFKAKPAADPMGALQRTAEKIGQRGKGTDRLPVALAETPPRDGPFAMAAQDVALNKPPRTRQRRADRGAWPFSMPSKLQHASAGRPPDAPRPQPGAWLKGGR